MSERKENERFRRTRGHWPRRRFRRTEPVEPGRPRKAPEKLRSKRLRIRVSESELAALVQLADGRSLPGWIRERLLGETRVPRRVIPLANREIVGQLAKIGNNFNQLVRLAHTGRRPAQLEPLLRELLQALGRYQSDLLGGPP